MVNLLIADDEEWIRESIRIKLGRSGLPIGDVFESDTSEGALTIIEKERVDIILCDIRMGGMDGLTLCGILSQGHPHVQKIIISGYSEFDYAVRAIQEGVAGYLLKPIDSIGLFDAIKTCMERMEGGGAGTLGIAAIRERVYENSDNPVRHLRDAAHISRLMSAYTADCALAFISAFAGERSSASLSDVLELALRCAAGRTFGSDLFFFKGSPLETILTLCYPPTVDGRERAALVRGVAVRLVDELRRRGAYDAVCGVEDGTKPPVQSYYGARDAMRHRILLPEEAVITAGMAAAYGDAYTLDRQLVVRLQHVLTEGSYNDMADVLRTIEEDLGKRRISYSSLKSLYESLLRMAVGLEERDGEPHPPLWRHSSVRAMLRSLRDLYQSYINITFFQQENNKKSIANRVRDYLDNHYDQHISLDELAKSHFVAPAYLSILFKEAFGVNFQDYLLSVRIRNAKRLLGMSRYKIKTIAEMTGFNDQHYFSRIFKRLEGITPREYMAKISPHNYEK